MIAQGSLNWGGHCENACCRVQMYPVGSFIEKEFQLFAIAKGLAISARAITDCSQVSPLAKRVELDDRGFIGRNLARQWRGDEGMWCFHHL